MISNEIEKIIYLAGIVDGEGTFNLWKDMRSNNRNISNSYSSIFSVSNNSIPLMDFLKNNFEGNVSNRKGTNSFVWICHHRNLIEIIEKIVPFLIVKKEQAKIFIKFRNTYLNHRPDRLGLDIDTIKIRESLWLENKVLNRFDRCHEGKWQRRWHISDKLAESVRDDLINSGRVGIKSGYKCNGDKGSSMD
jgi:hypothetical protein